MSTINPIDIRSSFQKKIGELEDFCKNNNIAIKDKNNNGIFDIDDVVEYTVQDGDYMNKIAARFNDCSSKELAKANEKKYPNPNKLKKGDTLIIPLKKSEEKTATKATTNVIKDSYNFKTRDFGKIKTRRVTDKNAMKDNLKASIDELQKKRYYVDDKNNNGIYDEDDILYQQVTVMLDAGHGCSDYFPKGAKINIPGKGVYIAKDQDSFESVAKEYNVDVRSLKQANPLYYDPGAVPNKKVGSKWEADFNGIAQNELAKMLEDEGFHVIKNVRTPKSGLQDRQENKLNKLPDIFMSIHVNSGSENESGELVCVNPASKKDVELAKTVNNGLLNDPTIKNKGIQERKQGTKQGLCVLNGDKNENIAEALVEIGYINGDYNTMDNPTTRKAQLKAIANGVISYYENHKESSKVTATLAPKETKPEKVNSQKINFGKLKISKPINEPKTHVVLQGETFYGICKKYGVSAKDMLKANPQIKDPANLPINTSLNIPTKTEPLSAPQKAEQAQKHIVVKGDTFYSICRAYGVSAKDMLKANPHITDPANLPINTSLNIPQKA